MLGAEIQGPVSRIVASADSATKEMNRLCRILRESVHPITTVIKLQLQDMRAALKKMRHSAMETISKRIIPDDMRIYIFSFQMRKLNNVDSNAAAPGLRERVLR